jgi:outer membrane lipoprotein SlyB
MSKEQAKNQQNPPQPEQSEVSNRHSPKGAAIGATGGGVAGAAVGRMVGGKTGAVIGAASGAVAGGIIGDAVADDVKQLETQAMEALGIAPYEDEVPAHYSWDELQELSKPSNSV